MNFSILRLLDNSIFFKGSTDYWKNRYKAGRDSGEGSYGKWAEFKAKVINEFMEENKIEDMIEHGCGDGNQLTYLKVQKYLGLDVSQDAINICREKFKGDDSKSFALVSDYDGKKFSLSLSQDVIFHLTEDNVYEEYMEKLFNSSTKYVMIYSSDHADRRLVKLKHVKHRSFSNWVERNRTDFELIDTIDTEIPDIPKKIRDLKKFKIYRRKES